MIANFSEEATPEVGSSISKQPRLQRQRHRDIDQFPLALRQLAGLAVGDVPDADEIEQILHVGTLGQIVQRPHQGGAPAVPGRRDQEVLDHRVVQKQLRNLEGTRDSEAGDVARPVRGDFLAEKPHRAGLRLQISGRDIEERGLAGAIRPDDGEFLAFEHVEIDAIGGDHPAKADRQSPRLEQHRRGHDSSLAAR